ncbi:MAG: GH116 family glycosyl-hydrolase [Sedimentisphaerales bacterium]
MRRKSKMWWSTASGLIPLKCYGFKNLTRIAMPIGGIGTGTVSLGGRGDLRDWELANRPAKGFIPRRTFFAVWAKEPGGKPAARLAEGPLPLESYEGAEGATASNAGLPRFRNCEFCAAYPFGQVILSDPSMPLDVQIEAFNPLIPTDEEASGIPIAVLRFVLTNKTSHSIETAVCGNLENFIGSDGTLKDSGGDNRNEFKVDNAVRGILMSAPRLDPLHPAWGTMALTTPHRTGVSYRTSWAAKEWNVDMLDLWDDFSEDGKLDDRPSDVSNTPMASLAVKTRLPAKGQRAITFLLTWYFPNRMTWTPRDPSSDGLPAKKMLTEYVRMVMVTDVLPFDGEFRLLRGLAQGMPMTQRRFTDSFINLHPELSTAKSNAVIYMTARIHCHQSMALTALLGYDGPVKLWVDGVERFCDPCGTTPSSPDRGRVVFDANAGEHEIVVAIEAARGQSWGIYLRFERLDQGELPQIVDQPPSMVENERVGNYYTTQYGDAWAVACRTAPQLSRLEQKTADFVEAFCESDIPKPIKEAALFNLSTLRTQTCFRTEDGLFFGWEGCNDRVGSCYGSCTHVWNYEQATTFLFGNLARLMREVEFAHATRSDGKMSFRVNLPLSRAADFQYAAADGQMGCLIKLYRDWQLSADKSMLKRLWPQARKALEFCWVEGGWDADADGVMEGCQHNTMDVEYYGPNPQMQIWYLGALRCAEAMARYLGEKTFADHCLALYQNGRAYTDEHLFNGEYYEQKVQLPAENKPVHPDLQMRRLSLDEDTFPRYQIASGCLVDQLVGQMLADVCGLGSLVDNKHIRKTLRSIVRFNRLRNIDGHFNHMRSYVLDGETGLLMASYPRGGRPRVPFPYYTEVMTGFEYTVAIGLLANGMRKEGLRVIKDIRNRYDGLKRNPFDEAECGHHYARAMASWAAVPAWTGFHYSAITGEMTFDVAKNHSKWFWSTGYNWGVVEQRHVKDGIRLTLSNMGGGRLMLSRLMLNGYGCCRASSIAPSRSISVLIKI